MPRPRFLQADRPAGGPIKSNLAVQSMPNYAWVCFGCAGSNSAGTEACCQCGMSARATGREIAAARRSHLEPAGRANPSSSSAPVARSNPSEPTPLAALVLIVFGAICLVGAYQSLSSGHWPVFMPPQMDLLAVPLSFISEKLGAWVGAVVAGVVGIGSIAGGLFAFGGGNTSSTHRTP